MPSVIVEPVLRISLLLHGYAGIEGWRCLVRRRARASCFGAILLLITGDLITADLITTAGRLQRRAIQSDGRSEAR
jgi:hypothetical protein